MVRFSSEQEGAIVEFYLQPNTLRETARQFATTPIIVRRVLRFHHITEHDRSVTYKCRTTRTQQNVYEKYGAFHTSCLESVKEKARQTNADRYGCEHPAQNAEIHQKMQQTCLSRWGVSNAFQAGEIKDRIKSTCQEKYGTASYMQSEEAASLNSQREAKKQATCQQRYGVKYFTQSQEYYNTLERRNEKTIETCLLKYGASRYPQTAEYRRKACRRYYYQGEHFDSSWELAVWIYAQDHKEDIVHEPYALEYELEGQTHFYHPDFLYQGVLIEVKGDHMIQEGKISLPWKEASAEKKSMAKQHCMDQNGVILWKKQEVQPYLTYVKQQYGKDYLSTFKIKGGMA